MYELFIFSFRTSNIAPDRSIRVSTVFCPNPRVDGQTVNEELRAHLDQATPPDKILFLGTEACRDAFLGFLEPDAVEGLPSTTRGPDAIAAVCLDGTGALRTVAGPGVPFAQDAVRDLRQQGLIQIFRTRGTVSEAPTMCHYEIPSGDHCEKFIRTANALVRGAEVAFSGFWLLTYLEDSVRHVYTDTAGINSVVYAALELREQVKPSLRRPAIDSFGSHHGLGSFKFDAKDESLFVISTSTSGSLAKRMVSDHQIDPARIVTLFYVGHPEPPQATLCDATRRAGIEDWGVEAFSIYPPDSCPLCKAGSYCIRLTGDQMVPENPRVVPVTIRKPDRPSWLDRVLDDFVGTGVIQCHRRAPAGKQPLELFLDLRPCFDAPLVQDVPGSEGTRFERMRFLRRLDRLWWQTAPASVRRIVYIDDSVSSLALAKRVERHLARIGWTTPPDLISSADLTKSPEPYVLEDGSTLVVAGTLVSGRGLRAVSQTLRQVQKNRAIQYLVGLARPRSPDQLEETRADLQFGEEPQDYDFRCVEKVSLPESYSGRLSPWLEERRFLVQLREGFAADESFVRRVDERINIIDEGEATNGVHDLFWRTVFGDAPLTLRPGFAFGSHLDPGRHFTQADVYFTMAAVLHSMRIGEGSRPARIQHGYQRVVLSPENFMRFDDGVVQASLLRAAERPELDYRSSEEDSRALKNVLESIFTRMRENAGEATVEFLLAMAGKKLRLQRAHARELMALVIETPDLPAVPKILAKFSLSQLGTD